MSWHHEAPSGDRVARTYANGHVLRERLTDVVRHELAHVAKAAHAMTTGTGDGGDRDELLVGIVSLLALTTDIDELEAQVRR